MKNASILNSTRPLNLLTQKKLDINYFRERKVTITLYIMTCTNLRVLINTISEKIKLCILPLIDINDQIQIRCNPFIFFLEL